VVIVLVNKRSTVEIIVVGIPDWVVVIVTTDAETGDEFDELDMDALLDDETLLDEEEVVWEALLEVEVTTIDELEVVVVAELELVATELLELEVEETTAPSVDQTTLSV